MRMARRGAGISQETLAQRLGIRRSAVTQWEHPRGTMPSMLNLLQAAVETRVAFEWLATGRGPMHLADEEVPAFSTDCIARCAEEEALLARFRLLSMRQREAILRLMSTMQ